jgi:hypothetical protein
MAELTLFVCGLCGPRVETVASAVVTCSCGRRCRPELTDIPSVFTATAGRCAWCGSGLDGKRAGARYCSDSHRQLAYQKRRKEVA